MKKAKTKTAGAVKGGNGRYQFKLAELKAVLKGDLSAVADQVKGEAQKRINEELQKASEKAGVDIGKVGESLKSGKPEDLQKTGEDLLGAFGKKKDEKKPTQIVDFVKVGDEVAVTYDEATKHVTQVRVVKPVPAK